MSTAPIKRCARCGKSGPVDPWFYVRPNGRISWCRACCIEYSRNQRQLKKKKFRLYKQEWRQSPESKFRERIYSIQHKLKANPPPKRRADLEARLAQYQGELQRRLEPTP